MIPSPLPDDHEDVSWALSTAQTTWDRGDFVDALKWLRRAAESASEAEADDRALALAKIAADLTTQLDLRASAMPPPVVSRPPPPPPAIPRSSGAPPLPNRPSVAPSRPSAPPLQNSQAPRASRPPAVGAARRSSAPPLPPRVQAGRPGLGLLGRAAPTHSSPRPSPPLTSSRPAAAHNLGPPPMSGLRPNPPSNLETTVRQELFEPPTAPVQVNDPDATLALASAEDLRTTSPGIAREMFVAPNPPPNTSLDDWPVDPLTAESPAVDHAEQRRLIEASANPAFEEVPKTRIGTPAYRESAISASSPPARPDADERVQTRGPVQKPMQAVRVVVWRGPDGVHIAPHGTTVSAISVEAMLVALDPSADLYAWLTNK